ncbi:MAG: deoxyhypusine synthase, partial [Candidatus Thorarchaeota archaeon]
MDRVHHIDPSQSKEIHSFLDSMNKVGVLGAGRLGRTTGIIRRMFGDPEYFTFLSMSGPMVPGGLRKVVSHLIEHGKIDAVVTSGANIVHDLVEAYGGAHYRVPAGKDDYKLREAGMGRIADIYVKEEDFEKFEKGIYEFLDGLPTEKMTTLAPSEFLTELGHTIKDDTSILKQAAIHKVPIFSPGLMDSMLGFHLYT